MDSVDHELARRFHDAYDECGVDRSQIRERLRLSPEERLALLEASIDAVRSLVQAVEGSRDELSRNSRRTR